jgi:hypothetical protein
MRRALSLLTADQWMNFQAVPAFLEYEGHLGYSRLGAGIMPPDDALQDRARRDARFAQLKESYARS